MKTHIRSSSTSNVITSSGKADHLSASSPSRKKAMQLYLQQYIHPEPISKNLTTRKKRNFSVQLSYLPYLNWEKHSQKSNSKPILNFRSKIFNPQIKTSTSQHKISTSMANQLPSRDWLEDQVTAKIIEKEIFSFDTRDDQLYRQIDFVKHQHNKEFKQFRKNKFFDKPHSKTKFAY